jgi:hypothetical protein
MQQINRLLPAGDAAAYKTYELAVPLQTHWRPASCAEVDCPHHLRGWVTTIDETSALGQMQAGHIRHHAGRAYTEARGEHGMTVFTFPAGQRCFASADHRVPLEREPLWLVRGGDWRGNPLRIRTVRHTRAEDWRDDFGEHQDRIVETIERG